MKTERTVLSGDEQKALRDLVYTSRAEPGLIAIRTLAEYHLEKCKERFLTCQQSEFIEIQAEARGWRNVLKSLTNDPT